MTLRELNRKDVISTGIMTILNSEMKMSLAGVYVNKNMYQMFLLY
jgi:hypothetical protein